MHKNIKFHILKEKRKIKAMEIAKKETQTYNPNLSKTKAYNKTDTTPKSKFIYALLP
jgi:hypothetical protein